MGLINHTWHRRINKTKYLEKHFGGKWKYHPFSGWWCDDNKRWVTAVSCDYNDEPSRLPPRYFLYGSDIPQEITWD